MQDFFRHFSPLFVYFIKGNSMSPTFSDGDKLLVLRFVYRIITPRLNDIVIASDPRDGKFLLKRITSIKGSTFFLSGDNKKASTDSKQFGMIDRSGLIGKVIGKI